MVGVLEDGEQLGWFFLVKVVFVFLIIYNYKVLVFILFILKYILVDVQFIGIDFQGNKFKFLFEYQVIFFGDKD